MKLLVVEDHPALGELLQRHLQRTGFVVDIAERGRQAQAMLELSRYDAMILDLGLPDMDGLSLLAARSATRNNDLPCIILTANDALERRVAGLDAGADDYLLKPFEMAELQARLRAVLRRPGSRRERRLQLGNLSLCQGSRDVCVGTCPLLLSKRELALLEELLRNAPRVVIKDHLEERLYALSEAVTPNAIEALVSRLRRKLADAGADSSIETLRGLGYRLTLNAG
ncbi:response regulator transcription factor [Pseudomonas aeruginosa]|uniref:response regulator n=1 Tax=Pseudomonas aeruginosa TaxID=287 RepID=UPI0021E12B79|nr:response regulator transcription factor [Pseudomonas aeruginosa]MCV0280457.1 response regulator transcription factor [Pseudomonas aeruginosa]